MKSRLPKDWHLSNLLCLLSITAFICLVAPSVASASIVTTTFSHNNGQSGNMFDINVLAPHGVSIMAFDLNLDLGNWDIQVYSRVGTHAGFETNPGAWTLHDSVTGLASAGPGLATFWDFENLRLDSGTNAFYVTVTNGSAMNYTNGSGTGNLIVDDGSLQIFEGTGNVVNFGAQFRPRVWNGSIHYEVIPEPGSARFLVCLLCGLATRERVHR